MEPQWFSPSTIGLEDDGGADQGAAGVVLDDGHNWDVSFVRVLGRSDIGAEERGVEVCA